ncbi:competence type IV pilus assembly protein ComGB [Psychrobacillus sp. NPDC058041]|uniref:competence type IV pilus assembly protein ComGB n=1 Tax=Psychrobacillus sp. NPDC058041 TaxID=3346310 RepID=UPI0036DCD71F
MLFQKVRYYFARKEESIPINVQSSFLKRLSDLLKEGYTFHESVSMLLPFHVKKSELIIQRVIEVHKSGSDVSEVFKLLGFPKRLILPISLAGKHGNLQETVSVLGVQSAIFENARKRMNTLLMYPLFLFGVIFLLFTVFRIYFLPHMESLLGTRNSIDTGSTIVWTNVLLQLPNFFLIGISTIVVLIFAFIFGMSKRDIKTRLNIYSRIPIFNSWYYLFLTRVFSREMGGLIESGMSIQQAFDALVSQKENMTIQYIANQMKGKIVHGESFSQAAMLLNYFTEDFYLFVTHGENSGYLGRELSLYSEFLTERIESKISKYLSILQPTLFIILAIFIIGAYLAILLPIYEMINIV